MLKICNIVLVLATLAAVGMCFPEPAPGTEEKCLEEFGITREEVEDTFALFKENVDSNLDRKYKCYTKCLLKIYGLREENGTFDVANLAEEGRTPERKEKITKVCNDCMATFEHGKDECEYSFKLFYCILQGIDTIRKEENSKKEQA